MTVSKVVPSGTNSAMVNTRAATRTSSFDMVQSHTRLPKPPVLRATSIPKEATSSRTKLSNYTKPLPIVWQHDPALLQTHDLIHVDTHPMALLMTYSLRLNASTKPNTGLLQPVKYRLKYLLKYTSDCLYAASEKLN